jgi:hypothetical protein
VIFEISVLPTLNQLLKQLQNNLNKVINKMFGTTGNHIGLGGEVKFSLISIDKSTRSFFNFLLIDNSIIVTDDTKLPIGDTSKPFSIYAKTNITLDPKHSGEDNMSIETGLKINMQSTSISGGTYVDSQGNIGVSFEKNRGEVETSTTVTGKLFSFKVSVARSTPVNGPDEPHWSTKTIDYGAGPVAIGFAAVVVAGAVYYGPIFIAALAAAGQQMRGVLTGA